MKNTGYRQRNRKLQYQIAGTILVVACVGFALLYFWQKYDARQEALRQAEQEEQEALEEARAQAEEEEDSRALPPWSFPARIPRSRLRSFRSRRR